jgi:hypothetical protein
MTFLLNRIKPLLRLIKLMVFHVVLIQLPSKKNKKLVPHINWVFFHTNKVIPFTLINIQFHKEKLCQIAIKMKSPQLVSISI